MVHVGFPKDFRNLEDFGNLATTKDFRNLEDFGNLGL